MNSTCSSTASSDTTTGLMTTTFGSASNYLTHNLQDSPMSQTVRPSSIYCSTTKMRMEKQPSLLRSSYLTQRMSLKSKLKLTLPRLPAKMLSLMINQWRGQIIRVSTIGWRRLKWISLTQRRQLLKEMVLPAFSAARIPKAQREQNRKHRQRKTMAKMKVLQQTSKKCVTTKEYSS